MQALEFWKMVAVDKSDFLGRFISLLKQHSIRYCVIGGQAVNAYVEPLVSLDLDVVVATDDIERLTKLVTEQFVVKDFAHSLNISVPESDLRVQIQTDPRYTDFVGRASIHEVLGLSMPVANLEDVLRGKVWAAQDPAGRGSKRQKDLADIARILESYPTLRTIVPDEILTKLD